MTVPGGVQGEDLEADVRTRLREAALDRFGRQGVHRTSTREIIAAAGLRNPSAITYYFGSKAELFEDLIREINIEESAILLQQADFADRSGRPDPAGWAATAIDVASELLATERGCLLVGVWAEYDNANPDAVEAFIASEHPVARAWRRGVAATFPDLPPLVAIGRNVIMLRTLQWVTVRRAQRLLDGTRPSWRTDAAGTCPFLLELSLNILTPPTAIADEQLRP